MFPTKANFLERWSESTLCVYCCNVDTDEHLFNCCGYSDLIGDTRMNHMMFMKLDASMDELSAGAKVLIKIHERLMRLHEDTEMKL